MHSFESFHSFSRSFSVAPSRVEYISDYQNTHKKQNGAPIGYLDAPAAAAAHWNSIGLFKTVQTRIVSLFELSARGSQSPQSECRGAAGCCAPTCCPRAPRGLCGKKHVSNKKFAQKRKRRTAVGVGVALRLEAGSGIIHEAGNLARLGDIAVGLLSQP